MKEDEYEKKREYEVDDEEEEEGGVEGGGRGGGSKVRTRKGRIIDIKRWRRKSLVGWGEEEEKEEREEEGEGEEKEVHRQKEMTGDKKRLMPVCRFALSQNIHIS